MIDEVNGSLAIEGMPLTEEDKENMRAVLRGDISFKDMKKKILDEYRQGHEVAHGQSL